MQCHIWCYGHSYRTVHGVTGTVVGLCMVSKVLSSCHVWCCGCCHCVAVVGIVLWSHLLRGHSGCCHTVLCCGGHCRTMLCRGHNGCVMPGGVVVVVVTPHVVLWASHHVWCCRCYGCHTMWCCSHGGCCCAT